MNTNKLNTALYEKMAAEQDTFRDWLKGQPPEEILNHAYEYTVREDIVMEMEELDLTDAQAQALLDSPSPLADVFRQFEKMETGHMENVRDCIEQRAEDVMRDREALLNTPVYLKSGAYARDNGELETFRASYRANMACKEALENAIRENYSDNHLSTDAVYQDVVGKFGAERVKLVLATTVRHKDWDQRFSRDNRAWAQTVPVEAGFGSRENDHSIYYVVDRPHSGLTDLFVSRFRKEQEKEKVPPARTSVRDKLRQEPSVHKPAAPKKREPER